MEELESYLGGDLSKIDNVEGKPYWLMSSDKYYSAMVKNVEHTL